MSIIMTKPITECLIHWRIITCHSLQKNVCKLFSHQRIIFRSESALHSIEQANWIPDWPATSPHLSSTWPTKSARWCFFFSLSFELVLSRNLWLQLMSVINPLVSLELCRSPLPKQVNKRPPFTHYLTFTLVQSYCKSIVASKFRVNAIHINKQFCIRAVCILENTFNVSVQLIQGLAPYRAEAVKEQKWAV